VTGLPDDRVVAKNTNRIEDNVLFMISSARVYLGTRIVRSPGVSALLDTSGRMTLVLCLREDLSCEPSGDLSFRPA
jgi:hypothetical protein